MGKNGTAYILMEEQETTVQFNRINDYANVCTSDSTMKTKLDKLCKNNPAHWEQLSDDGIFSSYRCTPKSLISFRSKISQREYTDEQRRDMADRLRNARSKNN